MHQPIRVFKLTHDDWHGSYRFEGYHHGVKNPMLVEVSLHCFPNDHRVTVWGNDDMGMEKEFSNSETAGETRFTRSGTAN